jgi:small conductance mechanosensitive channel
MVIRIVMKVRTSSKDDVARELRTRLKHSLDAMDVRLPSLSSVVLSGFDGATRVKGAKPPKTAPSAVVGDGSGSGVATKVRTPKATRAPQPPTTPNPPTSGDTP